MIDFKELQSMYGGKFVAILSNEKVIAAGPTFDVVRKEVERKHLLNMAEVQIRLIKKK